jgi:hypothetical protein
MNDCTGTPNSTTLSALRLPTTALRGDGLAFRLICTVIVGWLLCLAAAAIACRALYGDGAATLLGLLRGQMHYIDYDAQRTFASYITQTPVLIGRKLGLQRVSTYAGLYELGVFVLPAVLFMLALWISLRVRFLFATTAVVIAVFGFGANFINSEANLFLAFAWLATIILALPGTHSRLRAFVLPMIAFALLRIYEGMLLAGPVLAVWAFLVSVRTEDLHEKIGLTLAALLFLLGAIIGFGGFVVPRDPWNASGFSSSAFVYLLNPQSFVFLSALCALVSMKRWVQRDRWAWTALSVLFAATFVSKMMRLEGYYAYGLYYSNRAFLVLSLPLVIVGLLGTAWYRPQWISSQIRAAGLVVALVPLSAVMAVDLLGSVRWFQYMTAFCSVLDQPSPAAGGIAQLKRNNIVTGWSWTHPILSVLLRQHGSTALVLNDPGQWQPFDPAQPVSIDYRGLCESRRFTHSNPVTQVLTR